jgi:hypothetical protein
MQQTNSRGRLPSHWKCKAAATLTPAGTLRPTNLRCVMNSPLILQTCIAAMAAGERRARNWRTARNEKQSGHRHSNRAVSTPSTNTSSSTKSGECVLGAASDLRAVAGGGRARDGLGRGFPRRQAPPQGQSGEERRRCRDGAVLPRLSSFARRAARSPTEKPRPGQGDASTDHPAQPGDIARTDGRRTERLHHGLGDVLPPCGLQEHSRISTTGFVANFAACASSNANVSRQSRTSS